MMIHSARRNGALAALLGAAVATGFAIENFGTTHGAHERARLGAHEFGALTQLGAPPQPTTAMGADPSLRAAPLSFGAAAHGSDTEISNGVSVQTNPIGAQDAGIGGTGTQDTSGGGAPGGGAPLAVSAPSGEIAVRPLVTSDEIASGISGQAQYEMFETAGYGPSGDLLWSARVDGPGITEQNNGALWLESAGNNRQILFRESDDAHIDGSFHPVASMTGAALDTDGRTVLLAGLDPRRLAVLSPTRVSANTRIGAMVAAENRPITGLIAADTLTGIGIPAVGGDGSVAFSGHRGLGVWSTQSGSLSQIGWAGQPADPGRYLIRFGDPSVNANGAAAFRAMTTPESGSVEPGSAICVSDAGSLRTIAMTGNAAPGTGEVFTSFGRRPLIDDNGAAYFTATAGGTRGIWSSNAGSLSPVMLEGEDASGVPLRYDRVRSDFDVNGRGDVAFVAELFTGNTARNSALWLRSGGITRMIAREGDLIPGQPNTARVNGVGRPLLNERGEVLFLALLRGSGVTEESDHALLLADASGLKTLLRSGDTLPGSGSASRTVETIELRPGQNSPLNEQGEAVFVVTFTDGTHGIYTAGASCFADIATAGLGLNDPGFDTPDGQLTAADVTLFMDWWLALDLRADLTAPVLPGEPGYGVPDGAVTSADLSYFMNAWTTGCQ